MTAGVITLLLPLSNIKEFYKHLPAALFLFIFSVVLIGYSIYLLQKRKSNRGFYWDAEGVVIDLRGNKILWSEIEDITFFKSSVTSTRSSVIYTHYTHHETIRERHKKMMPVTSHSVEWIIIERPKDYHDNLMQAWEKIKNKKTFI
ncbi:hypothetical protein [Fictibacillus sp. 7GRE50]|uniref:hypothetical protein n=1 Tax=Fictibacillus sp. 7GRE50 TaxID=2745878 RepID=UPI001E5C93DA|nr:hypothetical protein [Fictibacillus sp. 7GRE50]